VSQTAAAADLVCSPTSSQQTFVVDGKFVSQVAAATAADGFRIITTAEQPDVIWNKPQWDHSSARAGGMQLRFVGAQSAAGSFMLSGGNEDLAYSVHVNTDDNGVRRYVAKWTMFVGAHSIVAETGTCR
jgi:hypothetical protein